MVVANGAHRFGAGRALLDYLETRITRQQRADARSARWLVVCDHHANGRHGTMVTAGPDFDIIGTTNAGKSTTNAVQAAIRPAVDSVRPRPAHVSEVASPQRPKWTFVSPRRADNYP